MKEHSRYASAAVSMALLALLLVAGEVRVCAQDVTPERGFQPGGSYAVSDIETISTTGGNMMLHFPVGKLPAGRGGLSALLSLNYDSKLYDSHVHHEDDPYTPQTDVVERNLLRVSDGGGWHYSFGYNLEILNRDDQYDFGYTPQYPDWAAISRWKVRVTFPDGTPHDFTLRGFDADDRLHDGYSDIRPDGYRSWWAGGGCWPQECVYVDDTPYYTGTLTYYSTDGTYARLDIQHDSDATPWNNPWTLYLPDGTRVENGTRIYDRNNNYIEHQFVTLANGHFADVLADQLGRSVTLEYNASANEDDIHVLGVGGEELLYRVKWKTVQVNKTYQTCMGCTNGLPDGIPLQRVVYEIDLPSQSGGLAYIFGYNAADYNPNSNTPSYGWGELSSITLPSGAQVSYQYANDGMNSVFDWQAVLQNTPTRKDLTYNREYDGASTPVTETWQYVLSTRIGLPSPFTSSIVNPDGGALVESGEQYGHVYKSVQPDGTVVESIWQQNAPQGFSAPMTPSYNGVNWYVKTEFTSIKDANGNLSKTAIKDYNYDKNGNVTQVKEYDWVTYASVPRDSQGNPTGVPAGAPLKRVTQSSLCYPTPDASDSTTASANLYAEATSSALRSLVASTEVGNGSQTLARTEFTYDNPATTGNLTGQRSWDSTKGGYSNPLATSNSVSVSYQYDGYGNRTLSTDAKGNQTLAVYGSVGGNTGLYPTQVTSAYGTAVAQTTTAEYDFYTGAVTRGTDANGVATATTYDVFGRPTLVKAAEGLSVEARTQIIYTDSARRVVTRKDLSAIGDGKLVSVVHYDQLGRVRLSRQLEDATTQSETDETQGIKVQTRYAYSGSNSYQLVSNPYRAGYSNQTGAEVTMGWSRSKSDSGGRVVEVQSFAGSSAPAPWGANTSSTGTVTTAYDAEFTTVTDQAGKVRRSVMNGLGQLARVDEPDGNGILGAISSPVQPTSYAYDALGNLSQVSQGAQTRTFNYSSLSRLTSATNPESGTVSYTYDNNGNLSTKTDARNITITYQYDALNRNTTTDYSNTTVNPDIERYYDNPTAGAFGRGRFYYTYAGGNSSAGSDVEHTAIDAYDALGRPLTQRQLFKTAGAWGATFQTSQTYNRAGFVTSETYPSGHTVSYTPDAAGRLASFTGNLGDGASRTYSASISYDASSRLQQEQFGTTTPLYHKLHYNRRGQLYDVRLSTQSLAADEWNWNRGAIVNYYSANYAWEGNPNTPAGADNNGNLLMQQHFVPGDDAVSTYAYTQDTFSYEQLNRLRSVSEVHGGQWGQSGQDFAQSFDYDRWGNRQINAAQTSGAGINNKQFTIDAVTNRLTSAGMAYDAAGNLTQDTYSAHAAQRTYDAENRMTMEQNSATSIYYRYTYDADGRRTRRDLGGQVTWQVYGFDGELLAEYAGGAMPSSPQKEYGYRGGELLVTAEPGGGGASAAPSRVNVAAASQGATASASFYDPDNTFCAGTHTRPSDAIDGVRTFSEISCGTGYWRAHPLPSQWLEVDFSGTKSISEIDVYTMRDNIADQSNPGVSETFTTWGATDYNLQYWDGAAWVGVPGASVAGNNRVWRSFNFAAITTAKIRLNVTGGVDGVARIAEVEAYTPGDAATQLSTFVTSFYRTILSRDPSAQELSAGVSSLTTAIGQGQSAFFNAASSLGQSLFLSQEYTNRGRTDHWFVYDLYEAFAGREPDAGGWAAWEAGVPSQGRPANVYGFSSSGNGEWVSRSNAQYNAVVAAQAQGGGSVSWLVSDHLGTPRMIVDQTGSLAGVKRHDYLPFGEELYAGAGGRTAQQGYFADSSGGTVKQKYTGYERDMETGLDFAEARYHSDTQGRFTSIDPLSASAKLTDPQSLNRYAYVGNNPVVFSDPSGMEKGHMSMPSNEQGRTVQGLHDEGSFVLAADEYAFECRLANTMAGLDGGNSTDTAMEEAQAGTGGKAGDDSGNSGEAATSESTLTENDPDTIDNKGSGQDCNISVSFTGDSINGMRNGENYYHGNPGLGFTVSISDLGTGGIASLGENKVDPKGHWVLQQLMNVSYWTFRQGDTAPSSGYVKTFSDQVDPRSIIRNDNRSGGWIDHPGPNMKNEAGQRLITDHSKWNFLIKAYNGKKECRVGFHAEMTFNNGIFRAHWGPGLY